MRRHYGHHCVLPTSKGDLFPRTNVLCDERQSAESDWSEDFG
jgi:hypothetical protein